MTAPRGAFFYALIHFRVFIIKQKCYDTGMKNNIFFNFIVSVVIFIGFFCLGYGAYNALLKPEPLKKATLFVFPHYQKNKAFDMRYGSYNYRYIFPVLQQMFLKHGYKLATQDIHPMEESDLIFIAWPYAPKPPTDKKEVSYLWLFESPIGIKMP